MLSTVEQIREKLLTTGEVDGASVRYATRELRGKHGAGRYLVAALNLPRSKVVVADPIRDRYVLRSRWRWLAGNYASAVRQWVLWWTKDIPSRLLTRELKRDKPRQAVIRLLSMYDAPYRSLRRAVKRDV